MAKESLKVGFDLPFSVRIQKHPADREALNIKIECAEELTSEKLGVLQSHLEVFIDSGKLGLLAGDDVRPIMQVKAVQLMDSPIFEFVQTSATSCVARCLDLLIPANALVLLVNKIFAVTHCVFKICSLEIELWGLRKDETSIIVEKAQKARYPLIYSDKPFQFSMALPEYYESVYVTLRFKEKPSAAHWEFLQAGYESWAALALQGSFISPPYFPPDYFVSPENESEWVGNELTWHIEKYWIDEEALYSLVNFLIAHQNRFGILTEVRID